MALAPAAAPPPTITTTTTVAVVAVPTRAARSTCAQLTFIVHYNQN